MSRISITPEELRTTSSDFNVKASDITEILDFLDSAVADLESTWDGAAQSQFFNAYEEMKPTLRQFPEVVDGIANQLTVVADTLEETDASLAASLQG